MIEDYSHYTRRRHDDCGGGRLRHPIPDRRPIRRTVLHTEYKLLLCTRGKATVSFAERMERGLQPRASFAFALSMSSAMQESGPSGGWRSVDSHERSVELLERNKPEHTAYHPPKKKTTYEIRRVGFQFVGCLQCRVTMRGWYR